MLRAVIFDFDGVIVDSELVHYTALNKAFAKYDIQVPKEKYWSDYLAYNDLENILAVSRDYNADFKDEDIRSILQSKSQYFDEMVQTQTALIDGASAFISMLKTNTIPMAIYSGSNIREIELMLKGTDLIGCFQVIVTGEDVKKSKPDPEGYLLAFDSLNQKAAEKILPQQCVVIEDSHWGLQAAQAANMKTVAVTNTYPPEKLAQFAEKVVKSLDELSLLDLENLCPV